jgi:CBS domain-containing protein
MNNGCNPQSTSCGPQVTQSSGCDPKKSDCGPSKRKSSGGGCPISKSGASKSAGIYSNIIINGLTPTRSSESADEGDESGHGCGGGDSECVQWTELVLLGLVRQNPLTGGYEVGCPRPRMQPKAESTSTSKSKSCPAKKDDVCDCTAMLSQITTGSVMVRVSACPESKSPVAIFLPDAKAVDTASELLDSCISCVLIRDPEDVGSDKPGIKVVGIVTKTDMVEFVKDGLDPSTSTAKSMMNGHGLMTISADASLLEAANMFKQSNLAHLLVTSPNDSTRVIGLLGVFAIMRMCAGESWWVFEDPNTSPWSQFEGAYNDTQQQPAKTSEAKSCKTSG